MALTQADIDAMKAQLAAAEQAIADAKAAEPPPPGPKFALDRGNLSGVERSALEAVINAIIDRVEKIEGHPALTKPATATTTETLAAETA